MAQTEAKIEMSRMLRYRGLMSWCGVVVLVVLTLCIDVALAGDQARQYRVAILTPGLSFLPVLEGLQEGLERLGYVPGKNLTLVVEDTHGAVSDLAQRVAKLTAANLDVLVTVGTPHTRAARQATDSVPIVFTRIGDPLQYGMI